MEVRNWGYVIYMLLLMTAIVVVPITSFLVFSPIIGWRLSAGLCIVITIGIWMGGISYYDS